jgi:prepilin peptidase CpaA
MAATAMHIWTSGASGALQGFAGMLAGLAAFLPFYLAGGFGAGDIKAMGAVGSFLGVKGALLAAAWILISGAIAGLVVLTLHGALPSLRARARKWALQVHATWATGRVQLLEPAASDCASQRFPYGLAIACGTLVSVLWSQP